MSLTPEQTVLFRGLHRLLSDPATSDLIVKYAKIEYDKAVRANRHKTDTYEHGYHNGNADAWEQLINLKDNLQRLLR